MLLWVFVILGITILFIYFFIQNYVSYEKFDEKKRLEAMNGMYNKPYILYSHHKQVFDLLKMFVSYCEKNNISYVMHSGALIGLVRHNSSFIPWDDDINIAILETDEEFFTDYYKSRKLEIIKYTGNQTYKSDNQPFLDLFILDKDTLLYKSKKARQIWPREEFKDIYPLKKTEFVLYNKDGSIEDKVMVNVPNDIIKWITKAYGENVLTNFVSKRPHCMSCFVTPLKF